MNFCYEATNENVKFDVRHEARKLRQLLCQDWFGFAAFGEGVQLISGPPYVLYLCDN